MDVTIDGRRVHVESAHTGEPVLFVHGFPLSHVLWLPTAQRLRGWRCIMPDLRGHGRSEPTEQASIRDFADDLATLLDHLCETRPVVVCGLSMGGIIAFEFFRRWRRRTRALVLVDCRANAETAEGRTVREAAAQRALREGCGASADEMTGRLFAPEASASLKQRWRDIMAATPPAGLAAAARALADRPDSTPTLAAIDVPTLLVFGQHDVITPPDVGASMHAAIRGSRMSVIAGAGHLPPVEQPDVFASALQAFLDDLPAL